MCLLRIGIVAGALSLLLGSRQVMACDVVGSVVCEGTSAPVSGVVPTFTHLHWDGSVIEYSEPPFATDENGRFAFHVDGQYCGEWYDVSLDPADDAAFSLADPVFLDYQYPYLELEPFVVGASQVGACAPPPVCEELLGETERSFCPDRGLFRGDAASECAYFGLSLLGKDDFQSTSATRDADLALVKAGQCYRVYLGVVVGDALEKPERGGAISHVTYCGCLK
jgi:hypothetical protein